MVCCHSSLVRLVSFSMDMPAGLLTKGTKVCRHCLYEILPGTAFTRYIIDYSR